MKAAAAVGAFMLLAFAGAASVAAADAAEIRVYCSGAPADSTCFPSQVSASLSGNTVAPFSVKVTTTAPSSVPPGVDRQRRPFDGLRILAMALMLALGLALLASVAHFRGAAGRSRRAHAFASTIGFLLLAISLISCGGGGSNNSTAPPPPSAGTPAGTYTLTVTAASGSASHNTRLTLVVNAAQ